MAKEDIRRYSLDEIRRMNERGDFAATDPEAPVFEGDDEFWAMVERGASAGGASLVQLELDPKTVEYFKRSGPDYRGRMAAILNEAARKAS